MNVLLLLLFVLAAQQLLPFEASMDPIENTEAEDNEGFFFLPRKLLSEADEDRNGLDTKINFPGESDGGKPESLLEEERKRSKQLEDAVMEAIEELTPRETQQIKDADSSSLSDIGEDELLLEDGKKKNRPVDKAKKEKEKDSLDFVSTNNEMSDLSQDKQHGEPNKKVKMKKEQSNVGENIPRQSTENKRTFHSIRDSVQGFSDKGSLSQLTREHEMDDFLLGTAEEKDGSNLLEVDTQDYAKLKRKMQNSGVKLPKKAEKLKRGKVVNEKYGSRSEILYDGTTKSLDDAVEGVIIETKERNGGTSKRKSKHSDVEDLTGVMTTEISDEETPADWTGERDREKPWKKLKTQKKPEVQISQEANPELTRFYSTGHNAEEMKKKKNQSELKEWLDESNVKKSDLNSAQADPKGKSKVQTKKTKKVKSDRLKEGESDLDDEKDFGVIDKKEDAHKANEKLGKKEKLSRSSQKAEKKFSITGEIEEGSQTSNSDHSNARKDEEQSKTVEVIDPKTNTNAKSVEQVDAYGTHFKQGKKHLPTIKKEAELDLQVKGVTAKDDQENAESSTLNSADSLIGVDDEDDEYSDFKKDFSDWSMTFQDTALKVADHLGPNIQKLTDTSKTYFNKANLQITESFSPLVGKQFAPFVALLLSYGLLLAPLVVVIILFEHIRAMLSLQKVLLFVNIYLAAYFATLLLATFVIGEPMNFFYRSSANGYVHLQLLQALGYIIYLILQTIDLVSSCSSEVCSIKVTVVLQWFVAVTIGFHYYVTVFHRAMILKGPHTSWKIYGVYSSAFVVLSLFARIKRVKKGYVQDGQPDTDKKQ